MERQATIIQADAAAFKNLVQKLTGGSDRKLRPIATVCRRSPFKLHERRRHSLRELEVIKSGVESDAVSSPGKGGESVSGERGGTESPSSEEERNIAEKGFYLHASPGKAQPPVLLTLFPLTSPKEF